MLVILGYIILCVSVFGGFSMAGGHLAALFQPSELLMIGGAAIGAVFVGNDIKSIRATLKALSTLLQSSKFIKKLYMDILSTLFEVLTKIRKDGMMSVENDIEDPDSSAIFTKYPVLLQDHHLMEFICD